MEVIKAAEKDPKLPKVNLARKFDLPESTLRGILKNKDLIEKMNSEYSSHAKKRSRMQSGKFETLETALIQWFREMRASNLPISSELFKEKALSLSSKMGIEDFSASWGWLEKLKRRHGLTNHCLSGESAAVEDSSVDEWMADLPDLIKSFDAKNIFNCDETGLFYRLLPNKTLDFKGETCHGGKHSKDRLTVLLCCNADGSDKMPPLVIGKSMQPRCFKNTKKLPCSYANSSKAWMTSKIFLDFLKDFDKKMAMKDRSVLLFMDQCPAHPSDLPSLKHTKIVFFPVNCTSRLQPLDLGIIRSVKAHYRKDLVRRMFISLEQKKQLNQLSILDAMHMLVSSWNRVTPTTISNCFRKAGFFEANEAKEVSLQENINSDFDIGEEEWSSIIQDDSITFQDFVNVDENLTSTELRDIETVFNDIIAEKEDDDEDDNDVPDSTPVPSYASALGCLETLRRYLQNSDVMSSAITHINELEKIVLQTQPRQKQTSIKDFLKKD